MRRFAAAFIATLLFAQSEREPARILLFEASAKAVKVGEPVELRWSATGADRIRLDPFDQDFPAIGQTTFVFRERTVFWIHAFNARGGQSVPLVVEALPEAGSALPGLLGLKGGPRPAPAQGGIWIQLAALADPGAAERLGQAVTRLTRAKVKRFEIEAPDHPGQILHRLRIGPYASVREARKHLRNLQTRLGSLHIQPIVAVD